jgi:CHAT domain-containing protein
VAELQLRRGQPDLALKTLKPAGNLLSRTSGYFIPLHYYQVLGNCHRKLGNLDLASEAYKQAIVTAEDSLRHVHDEQERLEWIRGADDAYRGLVRTLLAQGKSTDALKLWEWYKARSIETGLTTQTLSDGQVSWPEIWRQASQTNWNGDVQVRIIYAMFDDGLQIWTITGGHLRSAWVFVERQILQRSSQDFSAACARPDSSLADDQHRGRVLFNLMITPIEGNLPAGSAISIELDYALANLPMEALYSSDQWYLGERYPIVYSPGLFREKGLRKPKQITSRSSLLLVDAATNLPGRDIEYQTISRLFPTKRLLFDEAHKNDFKTALSGAAIFHFIGHGDANLDHAELQVGPHVLLRAPDFSPGATQHLQLAVLAACSTAQGGTYGLLDNRNLIHAFLAGGIPSVIASNWNIDSIATAELMRTFYTQLLKGDSPAAALFHARNQELRRHQHPYFWSGLSLIGGDNWPN